MLPRVSKGVVDSTLKVYGTANVRVVDCSIIPLHVSAHVSGKFSERFAIDTKPFPFRRPSASERCL